MQTRIPNRTKVKHPLPQAPHTRRRKRRMLPIRYRILPTMPRLQIHIQNKQPSVVLTHRNQPRRFTVRRLARMQPGPATPFNKIPRSRATGISAPCPSLTTEPKPRTDCIEPKTSFQNRGREKQRTEERRINRSSFDPSRNPPHRRTKLSLFAGPSPST